MSAPDDPRHLNSPESSATLLPCSDVNIAVLLALASMDSLNQEELKPEQRRLLKHKKTCPVCGQWFRNARRVHLQLARDEARRRLARRNREAAWRPLKQLPSGQAAASVAPKVALRFSQVAEGPPRDDATRKLNALQGELHFYIDPASGKDHPRCLVRLVFPPQQSFTTEELQELTSTRVRIHLKEQDTQPVSVTTHLYLDDKKRLVSSTEPVPITLSERVKEVKLVLQTRIDKAGLR